MGIDGSCTVRIQCDDEETAKKAFEEILTAARAQAAEWNDHNALEIMSGGHVYSERDFFDMAIDGRVVKIDVANDRNFFFERVILDRIFEAGSEGRKWCNNLRDFSRRHSARIEYDGSYDSSVSGDVHKVYDRGDRIVSEYKAWTYD